MRRGLGKPVKFTSGINYLKPPIRLSLLVLRQYSLYTALFRATLKWSTLSPKLLELGNRERVIVTGRGIKKLKTLNEFRTLVRDKNTMSL